jgi:hypothetical protein
MTNSEIADWAAAIVRKHSPRSPERRAAAAAWAALSTTRSVPSARRALATFGTPETQAAAEALLDHLAREAA